MSMFVCATLTKRPVVRGLNPKEVGGLAKHDWTVKQAADELGVSVRWIRKQIAESTISPMRRGSKRNGRFALNASDLVTLGERLSSESKSPAIVPLTDFTADVDRAGLLARIDELETDRNNLQAHVAWARAIAKEQQKALEIERERTQKLAVDLEVQRARVEALKALSTIDRMFGRHKAI
jgi:hypothetical protein